MFPGSTKQKNSRDLKTIIMHRICLWECAFPISSNRLLCHWLIFHAFINIRGDVQEFFLTLPPRICNHKTNMTVKICKSSTKELTSCMSSRETFLTSPVDIYPITWEINLWKSSFHAKISNQWNICTSICWWRLAQVVCIT